MTNKARLFAQVFMFLYGMKAGYFTAAQIFQAEPVWAWVTAVGYGIASAWFTGFLFGHLSPQPYSNNPKHKPFLQRFDAEMARRKR